MAQSGTGEGYSIYLAHAAGNATFGASSHFEGIILSMTSTTFQTEASLKGRALAQTAVILDGNTLVGPE